MPTSYIAAILTAVTIALAPAVAKKAHAQGDDRTILLERLDPDMGASNTYAQSDRQRRP